MPDINQWNTIPEKLKYSTEEKLTKRPNKYERQKRSGDLKYFLLLFCPPHSLVIAISSSGVRERK